MTTGKALNGKPYAGNPHVAPSPCYGGTGRIDEGEVASAAMPRRGSLLYTIAVLAIAAVVAALANAAPGVATVGNAEIVGKARFTLLTDRMVRCEWSEDGEFEDRPSVNRAMSPVKHTLTCKGDGAAIETDRMRLEWTGGAFDEHNLVVNGIAALAPDTENLLGTMRTIDGRSNIKDLLPRMEQGLLSRRGVTVVDDTSTPLFVNGGEYWKEWVAERPKRGKNTYRDIVVFAYGHDYKGCLGDYVRVAGRIPLPPRWAFGYWWSRFWPDSDSDYREVVRTMDSLGIPMDVCVIEMYWHETWNIGDRPDLRDESGQRVGWGGYTWNRRYFHPFPCGGGALGRGVLQGRHRAVGSGRRGLLLARLAAEAHVEGDADLE